ncbi:hypothetical protein FA13DRAFT_1731998 [Coprinellus micaceus]|uniref:Uncharacterized protein n=1 Tax=Coprinellus micaceus TaxID=71717 RepID=A0A4Y7TDJ6_COPMI|nr:hypothetical protein FA13DRAFT_1731998 [Coprinellus micaceus]
MNDKTTSALQALVSVVETPESLAIHVTTGGWTNITQVTLSWRRPSSRNPSFAHLASLLPTSVVGLFKDFPVWKDVEGGQGITGGAAQELPALWPFFGAHFLPGRGFANIEELCIREKFSWQEKGMKSHASSVFRKAWRTFHPRSSEAIYDANLPHLHRLPAPPSPDVPAELALNCIGMYCLYLPATNVDVTVEIEIPNDVASNARALLVVRGFPGTLPAEVGASGRAVVCGYPVVFMASRG